MLKTVKRRIKIYERRQPANAGNGTYMCLKKFCLFLILCVSLSGCAANDISTSVHALWRTYIPRATQIRIDDTSGFDNGKVDVSDRQFLVIGDGGYLPAETQIVQALFAEYDKYKRGEVESVVVRLDRELSEPSYQMIASFYSIYFSNYSHLVEIVDTLNYKYLDGTIVTEVILNVEMVEMCKAEKEKVDAKIQSIVSSFAEGTETQQLQQIADWLKDNVEYELNVFNAYPALFTSRGSCNAFSSCFREMASQLGIACDICVGWANGERHAWNRVTLSNGEYRYYDITGYDITGNIQYLNSVSSPWPEYKINNYW